MRAVKEGAGLEEEHGVVGGGGQALAKKPHHRVTTPVGRRASLLQATEHAPEEEVR